MLVKHIDSQLFRLKKKNHDLPTHFFLDLLQ